MINSLNENVINLKDENHKNAIQLQETTLKNNELSIENTNLINENNLLIEKLNFQKKEIAQLHEQTTLQFETIAQRIFDEKSSKFTAINKDNLDGILKPLNENIEQFKKQINETYDKESKLRFSLNDRILELMNQTNKISSEANNLASALKSNYKKQGDWGEVILENILEKSGLTKNREYRTQNNITTTEGKNLRPDIIIDLPNNRSIIIDAKVSLNAYDLYCNASDIIQQQQHLTQHIKAIKNHIDELSAKNYHELINGLDFTMLFIPIEPAYLAAIQHDQNLWTDAYNKRILLISPTNLMACLKLISDLWQRDKQDKSAQKIVKQAEKIYEKTVLFTKSFDLVGKQLQQAQEVYHRAQNQLKDGRGNILSQTNQLIKYGVSSKNKLTDFFDEETDIVE